MRIAALVVLIAAGTSAHAMVPKVVRVQADTLTALPAAHVKPLRTHVERIAGARPTAAWHRFAATGTWEVTYDAATGVPAQIWGSGIAIPGASAQANIAAGACYAILTDHLALLAPGAQLTDFLLVSNQLDDDGVRSLGFVQRAGGVRVLGGQVSFRIKRDRLIAIASQALPAVVVPTSYVALPRAALATRAIAAARAAFALPTASVSALQEDVIVPFVSDHAILGYRRAAPIEIDSGGEAGKYVAYVDLATGEPLAARQLDMFATGTVDFNGVDRYPGRARVNRPAPRNHVTLADTTTAITTADGAVTWPTPGDEMVTLTPLGDLVTVVDKTAGATGPATLAATATADGTLVWDASADAPTDAQLITYLSINKVKEFVRANVDANLPKIDEAIVANTNLAQDCNAFFDGEAVNFFHASAKCENTGRIEDVVFHEFGHNVHSREIIDGVGNFDGAMSEGAADFLAASITGDSGMGRGFFFNDNALRELDPADKEWTWPRDIGEIHFTGQIFGGTFWDLRKALIAQYGDTAGIALTLKLYVGALRRSVDIPSTLVEVLVADDDDGDLSNGTPNECLIREVWGHHGMRSATGSMLAPDRVVPVGGERAHSTQVTLTLTGLSARCPGDEVHGVTLNWRPGPTGEPAAGSAPANATQTLDGPSDHQFYANLPLPQQDVVYYRADVDWGDDTFLVLADNFADPYYQTYQGDLVNLYCTTFDTDPFAEGWTTSTRDGTTSPWAWGVPPGTGATDPPAAFSGTHALVQALGGDYPANTQSQVTLPTIDVGNFTDVRLQYHRWLASEDSHFDQAQILANGNIAWMNASMNNGDSSSLQHIDREWRFHDVPLTGKFTGHQLTLAFSETSDPGLELGGWAIDDLCVVANPHSVCGDGVKTMTEACDDGIENRDLPDRCRTYCALPACGDGIVDTGEQCDDGAPGSFNCTQKCTIIPRDDAGFCQAGGGSGVGLVLLALVFTGRRRTGRGRARAR